MEMNKVRLWLLVVGVVTLATLASWFGITSWLFT